MVSQLDQSDGLAHTAGPDPGQLNQSLYNPVRSTLYIVILTLIIGALQLAWSTEFSEATPFLLSLGISKHVLALVWLAGPLSGSIGQPIVGLLSDRCNLPWGRRRIFILIGAAATLSSLLYLSHVEELVALFVHTKDRKRLELFTVPFACIGVYVLDFSIAVIQASSRALIVDVVPTSQQQIANAWAARMIGIFNIVGFCFGSMELPEIFPIFGDTQFKVLTAVVVIITGSLTVFSCWYVKERNPQKDIAIQIQREKQTQRLKDAGFDVSGKISAWTELKIFCALIISSFRKLPPQVKTVCYAEFFAWVGYFPVLFYTSSYVGGLYLSENGYADPDSLPADTRQRVLDESTRRGTIALLANAVVTLAVDCLLPFAVDKCRHKSGRVAAFFSTKWLWVMSHLIFIAGTLATFFVTTSGQAVVLFGFLGIPWGCAVWIPFVLISEEISRIKDIRAVQITDYERRTGATSGEDPEPEENSDLMQRQSSPDGHYVELNYQENDHPGLPIIEDKDKIYLTPALVSFYEGLEYDSGILLAIHNVFVSAPQMLSSVMSSVLFKLLDKGSGNDSSLPWIFRFGGLAATGAFALSTTVKTDDELYTDDNQRAAQP